MIDIHSHLLPGVDDGSRSIERSVEVLTRFGAEGVTRLVCTPHLNATDAANAPYEHYATVFAELVAAAPPTVQLDLGWEIMLDVPDADLTLPHLSLGGSTAVLVEFPRTGVPAGASGELLRIARSGRVPVVAHPERYFGCTVELVDEWRRAGAAIQTDAALLLGKGRMSELAKKLLADGLIDCLASDNHGDSRSLARTRDWLVEIGAPEQAEILTSVNPGRLLRDERPLPVAPVHVGGGALARLRDLFRRRR